MDRRLHPKAHSIQPAFCGHCPNCHLILKDESGEVIAEAVMSADQLEAAWFKAVVNEAQQLPASGIFGTEDDAPQH